MRELENNLAVAGEHAGVIDYPRSPQPRRLHVSWVFCVLSAPAVIAVFVPFFTPPNTRDPIPFSAVPAATLVKLPTTALDALVLCLTLGMAVSIPMLIWRIRLLSGSPSPRELAAGAVACRVCLVPAFSMLLLFTFMAIGEALLIGDASVMVIGVGAVLVLGSILFGGLWIARRAQRRISPEAGITARLLIAYILPASFPLVMMINHRHIGYYLALTSESFFIVEIVLLALGQWPPRIFGRRLPDDQVPSKAAT